VHEDDAQEASRHLSRSHSANDLAQVSILLCIVANLFASLLISQLHLCKTPSFDIASHYLIQLNV